MQTLLLLLILVPAPKDNPPFPVGSWSVEWGTLKQGMTFYPDGTYSSPEYGVGFWTSDREGNIWFSEQNDSTFYTMWIDPQAGVGTGWTHCRADGSYSGELRVRFKPKGR